MFCYLGAVSCGVTNQFSSLLDQNGYVSGFSTHFIVTFRCKLESLWSWRTQGNDRPSPLLILCFLEWLQGVLCGHSLPFLHVLSCHTVAMSWNDDAQLSVQPRLLCASAFDQLRTRQQKLLALSFAWFEDIRPTFWCIRSYTTQAGSCLNLFQAPTSPNTMFSIEKCILKGKTLTAFEILHCLTSWLSLLPHVMDSFFYFSKPLYSS